MYDVDLHDDLGQPAGSPTPAPSPIQSPIAQAPQQAGTQDPFSGMWVDATGNQSWDNPNPAPASAPAPTSDGLEDYRNEVRGGGGYTPELEAAAQAYMGTPEYQKRVAEAQGRYDMDMSMQGIMGGSENVPQFNPNDPTGGYAVNPYVKSQGWEGNRQRINYRDDTSVLNAPYEGGSWMSETGGGIVRGLTMAVMAYLTGGAALGAGALAGGGAAGAAAGAGVGAGVGGITGLASSGGDWNKAAIGAGIGAISGGIAGGNALPATPTYEGYGGDLSGLSGFEFDPSVDYTPFIEGVSSGALEYGSPEFLEAAKQLGLTPEQAMSLNDTSLGGESAYDLMSKGGGLTSGINNQTSTDTGIPSNSATKGFQPNILKPLSRVLINGVLRNLIIGSGSPGGIPGGIPGSAAGMGPGTLADPLYKWTAQTNALTGLKGKSGYTRT